MPPKKLSGTEITRAQGQEITRKISARWSQSCQTVPVRKPGRALVSRRARARDGSANSSAAAITTQGV